MTNLFNLQYKLTGTGWSECIVSDDSKSVTITASYLSDALRSLAEAVLEITKGECTKSVAIFDEEPGEFRWIFKKNGSIITVLILQFDELWANLPENEGIVIFKSKCSIDQLKNSMIGCLDGVLNKYSLKYYRDRWGAGDFPMDIYEKLQSVK